MLERVGARGVREDAGVGVARLDDRGAGAVRVDHAVAVVRIGDARERIGADDERALDVAGADHGVGGDHALNPAGAAEDEIEGGGARLGDAQLRFDARGE